MAEILASWLNEEVGLSSKVTNFEEDFASGYLLGELLYKYNQQSDFEEFSSRDQIAHKLQNFEKLEPTLRNLNIKFDSRMVEKIMKRERGYALRLLYQLKMCLEKVYPTADMAVVQRTGTYGDNQPAQKIAKPRETYDKVQHQFFKQRIFALNKPQKQLNMEAHVQKFQDEKERQAKIAADMDAADKKQSATQKQEMRRIQINKLQRNAGFMEEWHQKGVEDWKKNQKRQRDRESKELEFNLKQVQKYNTIAEQKLNFARNEVEDGIAKFEETLKSNGINPRVTKEEASKAVSTSFQGSKMMSGLNTSKPVTFKQGTKTFQGTMQTKTGAFTLESTGLKHRTKKALTDDIRKQREKRRRRLITQQEQIMQDLELKERESLVVELIKKQSKQEQELDYEVWRTNQCKEVIKSNRQLREAQYEKRRELDVEIARQKEQSMLVSMQEATQRIVAERVIRNEEMLEYKAEFNTKNHTELCAGLLEQIFDIADEAYKHMQLKDSKDIDQRNWHEWQQLFLNNMPITNIHQNISTLISQETGGQDLEEKETQIDSSNEKLDELELVDYLKNKGQWDLSIVKENKPRLEEILNPAQEVETKAKGKGAPKAAAAEAVTFEEGDLEIMDAPDNNVLLGDALEQIIKINFEERARLKHPQTPNWLPLKLCLVGYPFAGKKTQADMIKQKFGLDVFSMETLIQEVIEFSEAHPDPIEKQEEEAKGEEDEGQNDSQSDISLLSQDEEKEFNLQEEFRLCGCAIQKLLLDGEEITDDLYVRLFVTKLRMQYEYKTPVQKAQEVRVKAKRTFQICERIKKIDEELAQPDLKKKAVKVLEQEKEALEQEKTEINTEKVEGWVLVDFPCSYSQAKLLEESLSGYKPTKELDPIQRDLEMEEAFLLVQPNAKEEPPKCLLKSGLDAVIWFNTPTQECQRRADGRRIDSIDKTLNAKMYHVTDVQPDTNQAPLCERLEPIQDEQNHTGGLVDRFVSFDFQEKSLVRWLEIFGVEEKNRNLLQMIDASKSKERVFGQIISIIEEILSHKRQDKLQLTEIITFKLQAAIEQKIQEMLEAQRKKEEEERQAQLEAEAAAAVAEAAPEPEEKKKGSKKDKESRNEKAKQDKSDVSAISAPKEQPGATNEAVEEKQEAEKEVVKLPDRDNIDNDFKPVIIRLWQDLCANYKCQMKRVFRNLRMQREQQNNRIFSIRAQFLEYLHTHDNKQAILDEFVQKFNDFSDENPDLREDDQTKEELHQRTDQLSDELWEIVEERKESATEFRKKIMESGNVEFNLAFLTNSAQELLQAEVDKFKVSIQIIHDYYHAIEEKLIPEAPPSQIFELGFPEGEEPPPVESCADGADQSKIESFSYPRLDKLLAQALKQQVVPDVTQIVASNEPKKGGASKKDPKKGATAAVEEEKTTEESIYIKEMKQAIKVEKSIFRYRLVQIRNWALIELKKTRQSAIDLYKMLEDWIYVSQKVEMDAIEEMCTVIKDSIEEESKIQSELRIKYMDFTVDQGVLNFITPPPPKWEALEDQRENRYTIKQLENLISEFENLCALNNSSDQMTVQQLFDLLNVKKNCSSMFISTESGIPQDWIKMNKYSFSQIIQNLDPSNSGFVNWKEFMTYVLLLNSHVCTPNDAQIILNKLDKDGYITEDEFVSLALWFDSEETSVDRYYSIPFERLRMLKQNIFRVHCCSVEGRDEKVVHGQSLVNILLKPHLSKPGRVGMIYKDFLYTIKMD